jgi:hypothetical protein
VRFGRGFVAAGQLVVVIGRSAYGREGGRREQKASSKTQPPHKHTHWCYNSPARVLQQMKMIGETVAASRQHVTVLGNEPSASRQRQPSQPSQRPPLRARRTVFLSLLHGWRDSSRQTLEFSIYHHPSHRCCEGVPSTRVRHTRCPLHRPAPFMIISQR